MNKASHPKGASTFSDQSARLLLEVLPLIMDFVRTEMRRSRATSFSIPQFRSLVFLKRHEGASLSDLAARLGVTRATASTLIERLVRQGLVERKPAPEERRRLHLTLTPPGAELVEQAQSATRGKMARLLANLSKQELMILNQGLTSLNDLLADRRDQTLKLKKVGK